MNNKSFIGAISISAIFVLLLAGMPAIELANANLIPLGKPTNPPPIIIHSPLNTTYNQNDILLNFTIVGISNWWIGAYHLTDVFYECDGKSVNLNVDSTTNTEQFYTDLVGLTKGEHTLTVHVNGAGLYYINYPNSSDKAEYSIESTQTVSFTIDKELENTPSPSVEPTPSTIPSYTPTSTITPTPTETIAPSNSPTPTLSPSPTDNIQDENFTQILIIICLVTVVIVGGLLVYFKRIKK